MEKVIASVTGYDGLEEHKLIKLIAHTGAYFVDRMELQGTRLSCGFTHLVCLKFEGRKYELAKRFNMIVVNHQWVEECVRQGRRVSEEPYMLKSGEEVGPLVLELPPGSVKPKRVYKTAHKYDKYFINREPRATSALAYWTDSYLLKEIYTEENRRAVGLPPKRPSDIFEEFENWSPSAIFKPQDDGSDDNKTDSGRQETEATEKAPAQVSCIICMTEISSSSGILLSGHRFCCYSCIQTLADRLVSETKKTTCPFCKSSFIPNTKIENAGSCDQKIHDKRYEITYERRRRRRRQIGEAS